MKKIQVHQPAQQELEEQRVSSWPVWTKEVSEFDWYYDSTEQCYILEGEIEVETPEGTTRIGPGDYVTFPKGLSCRWKVKKTVRKHYRFTDE
ncbi:MAG: cupin domain-containing protein [Bacteroidales bacterium]